MNDYNNLQFQKFMDQYDHNTVSVKVRSLMWECWVSATKSERERGLLVPKCSSLPKACRCKEAKE